jgi:hypothetical protein
LDAYLEIAYNVLKKARVPLPPREILRRALAANIVPKNLYGRTQHKTLQARLSEDILLRRERSAFFRTRPGYFFLREFLTDSSIAAEHRIPIVARRRKRELAYPNALAFDRQSALKFCQKRILDASEILSLISQRRYHYADSSRNRRPDDVLVWAFILVLRDNFVLTYRHGRYREDRDSFLQRRSVGFFSPVVHDDLTLFDQVDHGIVSCGMRALSLDLDLPDEPGLLSDAELAGFVCATNDDPPNILGLIRFRSPDWFEPLTRRLAINDLDWHDLTLPINHIEDFDPWSQLVLTNAQQAIGHAARAANAAPAQ